MATIDCDVHPEAPLSTFLPYLDSRWRRYAESFGLRTRQETDSFPGLRSPSRRMDAVPPGGGKAGSDPAFAAEQLLDGYGVDLGVLNCLAGQVTHVGINQPAEFSAAMARATNDWTLQAWMESDSRWLGTIHNRGEEPKTAVREIERCVAASDRFVQIAATPRPERPLGNPRYWDLFEAATHYDLPISLHPGGLGGHANHATGLPSTFYELHVGLHFGVVSTLGSLICEGVFERWPTLKFAVIESGWAWVAPWAWRLDSAWRVLHEEVPHLQRKPSEYLADHFWFSSQPMETPENPKWFNRAYEQFERLGLERRLMFATDYPHWDFDSPDTALPRTLPEQTQREIRALNACELYGLELPA
jgi:predicted TIM-barrel fold metal-dependent hydrolase